MPVDDGHSTWGGVSRALHRGAGPSTVGMIIFGWWINVVHVATAFCHHFIKPDDVTLRMFRQLRPSVSLDATRTLHPGFPVS